MAPIAISEDVVVDRISELKAKAAAHKVELEPSKPIPVPDNYMYDFQYNHELPTSDFLKCEIPADTDASQVADDLLQNLTTILGSGDASKFTDLFLDFGKFDSIALVEPES